MPHVCSYWQGSHWSYWDNLLRKEDKFRPVSCISFLWAKRRRKKEIALKYLKGEIGYSFFSPQLYKTDYFFFFCYPELFINLSVNFIVYYYCVHFGIPVAPTVVFTFLPGQ